MSTKPHVVVLGAGFAGLGAMKRLRGVDVRITLVDQHDYHTFQPLLYQVATDELGPNEVGFPLREILHHHQDVTFHQSVVQSVDLKNRTVTIAGMEPLAYDYLVLALGAVVNTFHTPGAAEHAYPLYTMDDALRLKAKIIHMLEAVDKQPSLIEQGALNFCIVGGGPTGVELAGALAELLDSELCKDYPNLPIERAKVLLYEHSPHVLAHFLPAMRDYALKELTQRGVEVRTGVGVTQVNEASIVLSTGETVPTHTLVWAAGLTANPVTKTLEVTLAPGGRVPVDVDLQLADYPGVFVVGDVAAMTDTKTGELLPGLGAVALQAGQHAGDNIARLVKGEQPEPFNYLDKGTMAQIGRGAAIAQLPLGVTLTGVPAWLAWLGVHLVLLSTEAERGSVFVDWGWNLLTRQRNKRIVVGQEEQVK